MLLDALEVKIVQTDGMGESETSVEDFHWDVSSFNDSEIELLIRFDNPDGIGSFASED